MKSDLEKMIAQEAEELWNAPKIKPILGQVARCHLCGAICSPLDLQPFDTHTTPTRHACPNCHPERGSV